MWMFQMRVRIQNRIPTTRSTWRASPMPSSIRTARCQTVCPVWIFRILSNLLSLHDPDTSWRCANRQWWTASSERSHVLTRDVRRCFEITVRCANICTRMDRGYTCVRNVAKLLLKVQSLNDINWCTQVKNHFSAHSKDAARGLVWTSISVLTWEFILATDRMCVHLMDAVKNLHNQRTSNRIY